MASVIQIRKAFETQLATTLAAYTTASGNAVAVNWPLGGFDRSKVTGVLYADPSLHCAPETPRTLGPSPAVTRKGFFLVKAALKSGQPQDMLDILVQAILDGFPYGTDLVAGADHVQIEGKTAPPVVTDAGWIICPAQVQWSINI